METVEVINRKESSYSEKPNNSDTISRQAAINAISCDITITGRQNAELVAATIGAFADRIKALPSARPEIIRCKDCKHFAGEGMYCSCDIIVQFDHFYCYHAERRTDEQTDRR